MHSANKSPSEPSIRSLLQRMGFEPRECEVYLALLSLKAGKVSSIAAAAKQPRTLAYVVLQKLEAKGIVSRVRRGRTLHFVAEPPRRLLAFADA
ncbi:MAG TPA: helix-turn-helix domain-containing protein, partial [Candidatus Peribacteria bacterium]|nr:helix-turn-helix domain-containing protein [Candidatus Peribacteria bacterium]